MACECVVDRQAARRSEHDVGRRVGTLRRVAATQLMGGDLLMHGIGLYMLIAVYTGWFRSV